MYDIQDIRHVHLEISSRCNAACPQCPRNLYGYPYNDGYVEQDMTLEQAQKIFSQEFLAQLSEIRINGNFGDIVMNRESLDVVEYFKKSNPDLKIAINTNASGQPKKFWKRLGELNCRVSFALDGLEDTHSLYRQYTDWTRVIANAEVFIKAGGIAIWKMIKFDHNQHQIDSCRDLADKLGFSVFDLIDHGRDTGPVFNRRGSLVHVMKRTDAQSIDQVLEKKKQQVLLEDIAPAQISNHINCEAQRLKSIYVSSTGHVYPCCFLGFNPESYGHGNYHEAANAQIRPLIDKNCALEYPLADCISWFSKVTDSWKISNFSQGRLVICDNTCGQ